MLVFLRAVAAVGLIVLLTRVNGLRTFSKMSGFDFAITVALGSVLASTVMSDTSRAFVANLLAIAALFAVQAIVARTRTHSDRFERAIDNGPLMLMEDGRILDENLARGQITRPDLMAKLREANATQFSQVRAVVLETTGDVSVLHGEEVDAELLEGVRR